MLAGWFLTIMTESIKKQANRKIGELLAEIAELKQAVTDRDNELKLAYGRITTLERSIAAYKGWQTRRNPQQRMKL